jgi:predicted nucleic acid-binding Zn ribbon protein
MKMPKYIFECPNCGRGREVEAETGSDAGIPNCYECNIPMKRLWTTAFLLRGEGWNKIPNDEIATQWLPDVPAERGNRSK